MWLTAAMMAGAALAGPNGLQALHNPQTEHAQQELLVERLGGTIEALPKPQRKSNDPPSAAEKRAAAWRADHLTCASPKGRTRAQFEAECKPADPDGPSS